MIHLSYWLNLVYLIYQIGSFLNISIIKEYVNPYYIVYLLSIGFIIYSVYLFRNNYRPKLSFYIIQIILHIAPLLSIKYFSMTSKYAIETLVITILIYFLYMSSINRYIYQVYNIDYQPESWSDYLKLCQTDHHYPSCFFFKNDTIKKYIDNNNNDE